MFSHLEYCQGIPSRGQSSRYVTPPPPTRNINLHHTGLCTEGSQNTKHTSTTSMLDLFLPPQATLSSTLSLQTSSIKLKMKLFSDAIPSPALLLTPTDDLLLLISILRNFYYWKYLSEVSQEAWRLCWNVKEEVYGNE